MSRRTLILLSIGIFVVVAGIVVAGLYIWKQNAEPQTPPTTSSGKPKPGDSVELSKVPDYQTCTVVTKDLLSTVDTATITSVSEGAKSGVVAANLENAQECTYTVKTPKSDTNTFTASVYLYAPSEGEADPNQLEGSWNNVSKGIYGYALNYPAYFNSVDQDENRVTTLHLIDGARTFRFIIEQPKDSRLEDVDSVKLLLAIANKANYEAAAVAQSAE